MNIILGGVVGLKDASIISEMVKVSLSLTNGFEFEFLKYMQISLNVV